MAIQRINFEREHNNKNINLLAERNQRKAERKKQREDQIKKEIAFQKEWAEKLRQTKWKKKTKTNYGDELEQCFRNTAQLKEQVYQNQNGKVYRSIQGALSRVKDFKHSWIKEPKNFKVRLYNPERQFSRLVRYLFAKYPVPLFMDYLWYHPNDAWTHWFISVAQGQNIRNCLNLPIHITKKIAHEMMKAPNNYTIEEALRYGQIVGMGGEIRMVEAILTTGLGQNFNNEQFWETVISWITKNPMLDTAQIAPLIDYIGHRLTTDQHFSMKGRAATALIRQMEEWHNQLKKERGNKYQEWKACDIPTFEYTEGSEEYNQKQWVITEILNSKDLREEGRKMHHCVASYESSCKSRNVAIFSLKCNDERCLSIEINLRGGKSIVQMRGLKNRLAESREKRIINMWSVQNHIIKNRYI